MKISKDIVEEEEKYEYLLSQIPRLILKATLTQCGISAKIEKQTKEQHRDSRNITTHTGSPNLQSSLALPHSRISMIFFINDTESTRYPL